MKLIFKMRGILMIPPVIFFTWCPWYLVGSWVLTLVAGGAVFLSGVALRVWAQMHLHYRLPEHKVLTETGPFSYVRNPIYVANILMLVGICFLCRVFWFSPVLVAYCVLVYNGVIAYEESHLKEKYGAPYLEFLNKVSRWVPSFNTGQRRKISVKSYFIPGIVAELHTFLLLIPPVLKAFYL